MSANNKFRTLGLFSIGRHTHLLFIYATDEAKVQNEIRKGWPIPLMAYFRKDITRIF